MTLTTTTEQTQLTMLLGLIKRKEDHTKEWKEIDKLFSIYSSELTEAKKKLHRTSAGALVTVHDMDDDHLFNTIAMHVKRNWFNKIPEKYKAEMKWRPAVLARVLEIDHDTTASTSNGDVFWGDELKQVDQLIYGSDRDRYEQEIFIRKNWQYSMGASEYKELARRFWPSRDYFNNGLNY